MLAESFLKVQVQTRFFIFYSIFMASFYCPRRKQLRTIRVDADEHQDPSLPSPTLPKQRGSLYHRRQVGVIIIRCLSLLFYTSSCFLHLCSSNPAAASSYTDYSQLSAHYFGYRIVMRKMEVQSVDPFVKVRSLLLLLSQVTMIGIVFPSDFVVIFRSCLHRG